MLFARLFFVVAMALCATGLATKKKKKQCHVGSYYCGRYLQKKGDYTMRIITHLQAHNVSTEDYNIRNSLWICLNHGDIAYEGLCTTGCIGDDKRDDYCDARGGSAAQDGEYDDEEDLVKTT